MTDWIALDVAAENGIDVIIQGALRALKHIDSGIILVGNKSELESEVEKNGRIRIVHADKTIDMGATTREILGQRDASVYKAAELVANGEAYAMLSPGNTRATVAAAINKLKRIETNYGKIFPGLAVNLPKEKDKRFVGIDMGAQTDSKPEDLVAYAIMGSEYSRDWLGIDNPNVGLLNIGEEPGKGDKLRKETYPLLENSGINFYGNVEPDDVLNGKVDVDVVVVDGFTGNVVLKTMEGALKLQGHYYREELKRLLHIPAVLSFAVSGMPERMRKRFDTSYYGGAMLLGLDGLVMVSHGRVDVLGITSALRSLDSHKGMIDEINSNIRNQYEEFRSYHKGKE